MIKYSGGLQYHQLWLLGNHTIIEGLSETEGILTDHDEHQPTLFLLTLHLSLVNGHL